MLCLHVPVYVIRVGDEWILEECVVRQKENRGKKFVQTFCSAPQCQGQLMHVAKEKNCFAMFHSIEYHHNKP